uniref:Serpentine receptor class gamma n=1 Tax=Rhabditophanes sp. KR3021 TaxID=114890 RepID=A0AC35TLN4_9BILA
LYPLFKPYKIISISIIIFLNESSSFRISPFLIFILGITPPLSGSILSICTALIFHNDAISNYNWQCGRARLPSLSRIINLPVERVFWQILILAHIPIRILEMTAQYSRYERAQNVKYSDSLVFRLFRQVYIVSGVLELLFLTGLSIIGERENTQLHVIFFYLFGISGIVFMIANTYLHRQTLYHTSPNGVLSFRLKVLFMVLYLIISPIMVTAFYMYWKKCLKMGYEVFALCEYLEVLINIMFHSTCYLDIKDRVVLIIRYVDKIDILKDADLAGSLKSKEKIILAIN